MSAKEVITHAEALSMLTRILEVTQDTLKGADSEQH